MSISFVIELLMWFLIGLAVGLTLFPSNPRR